MTIGSKLRSLRTKSKKTLKEQSEIFNVSLNTVYRWEHDLALPRKSLLERVSAHYAVPLEWLLAGGLVEKSADAEEILPFPENNAEQQLLCMFRKLSACNQFRILGYVERVCIEDMDKLAQASGE